jgi:hypothetical protein
MRMKKSLYFYASMATLGVSQFIGAASVKAADVIQPLSSNVTDVSGGGSLTDQISKYAQTAVNVILLVAGVVAILYLLWSGIQYITSAGNPEKAKAARAGIINAVIGIIIIVAAYYIIRFAVGAGGSITNSGA